MTLSKNSSASHPARYSLRQVGNYMFQILSLLNYIFLISWLGHIADGLDAKAKVCEMDGWMHGETAFIKGKKKTFPLLKMTFY